ncbi:DoxX family protein [Nocardia sp. NPDC004722]
MTAIAATPTVVTTTPSKLRNRVLWTLQIVLGLFFIVASGGPKLVMPQTLIDSGAAGVSIPIGLLIFIGVAEVSGGIGLMVRRVTGPAAAGLSVLTVLAAGTQAFIVGKPAMAIFPLVLAAIFAWIAYERRASFSTFTNLVK